MTPKELKQIVKLCRDNGIAEFKCGDLEIKFTSRSSTTAAKRTLKSEKIGRIPDTTAPEAIPEVPWAKLTDEQIATWSSQQTPDDGE